jgi:hypothetical protein
MTNAFSEAHHSWWPITLSAHVTVGLTASAPCNSVPLLVLDLFVMTLHSCVKEQNSCSARHQRHEVLLRCICTCSVRCTSTVLYTHAQCRNMSVRQCCTREVITRTTYHSASRHFLGHAKCTHTVKAVLVRRTIAQSYTTTGCIPRHRAMQHGEQFSQARALAQCLLHDGLTGCVSAYCSVSSARIRSTAGSMSLSHTSLLCAQAAVDAVIVR